MLGKHCILSLFPTRIIKSIKHEHSCKIPYVFPDCATKMCQLMRFRYLSNIHEAKNQASLCKFTVSTERSVIGPVKHKMSA